MVFTALTLPDDEVEEPVGCGRKRDTLGPEGKGHDCSDCREKSPSVVPPTVAHQRGCNRLTLGRVEPRNLGRKGYQTSASIYQPTENQARQTHRTPTHPERGVEDNHAGDDGGSWSAKEGSAQHRDGRKGKQGKLTRDRDVKVEKVARRKEGQRHLERIKAQDSAARWEAKCSKINK